MTQTSGYTSDGIGYQKQDTSYKAATKNKKKKLTLRQEVLQFFSQKQDHIYSATMIAERLGYDMCQIQPRISELSNQGLIVDSGFRGKTKYNRPCVMWRYKDQTKEYEEIKEKQDSL